MTKVAKVIIVEDEEQYIDQMATAAILAGHEVWVLNMGDGWKPLLYKGEKCYNPALTMEEICNHIRQLPPDIVFLDHFLGHGYEGQNVAELLKLPKEKLVGTGSTCQSYCGKKFEFKDEISAGNDAEADFLKLICQTS